MSIHPGAGKLAPFESLQDIPELISSYYTLYPDPAEQSQRVSFGTSGHRGSSLNSSFNEDHIYAVTQAICELRQKNNITGPLFLGMDTHALSEPAYRTALEVLVANGVNVHVAKGTKFTPTPAISHAILCWNRDNPQKQADGIVITPSHNPPADGGFKYNPPHGGPADTAITKEIENRANELLSQDNKDVNITPLQQAQSSVLVAEHDFISAYVDDLANVIDMKAIAASNVRIGVDPLGGASLDFWEPIAEKYKINLTVVNKEHDPTFRFVPCDKDGKIRMDCSSPYVMSKLLNMKDDFDLACGCDPDSDRHGIVTPKGLMNPNHFLSVAAWHLFRTRKEWPQSAGIGKTLVTSSMIDRVAEAIKRKVVEVPVGFKWFVPLLHDKSCGFGCEESAGASFLRFDGTPWSTDKDGILLCLLAAEITAVNGKNPSEIYEDLANQFGSPLYERLDTPADDRTRKILLSLTPASVRMHELAGSPITAVLTHAPGNGAAIGGVKVVSRDGWFAVRPSGTENICKVYTESFKGPEHLAKLQHEAVAMLEGLLKRG